MSQNEKKTVHDFNEDDNNNGDYDLKHSGSGGGVSGNEDGDSDGGSIAVLDINNNNNNRLKLQQNDLLNERSRQLQPQQFKDQKAKKISIKEEEELVEEVVMQNDNSGANKIVNSKHDLKSGNF